ncbi:TraR/DksA family transcriptional regulator [Streptomyces chartreusis]|uniref:TraR/DksA family transcriptional regulator n=1 Tax=Streptomyces chartreusis TaxID=1969 RepID=UPI00363757E5
MVAKRTAVQQSASSRSTHARAGSSGGAAKDVHGKKAAQGGTAEEKEKGRKGAGQETGGRSGKGAAKKAAAAPKAAGKKTAGKKAVGKKEAAAAKPAARKSAEKGEAKEAAAGKSAAKKSTAKKSTAKKSTAKKSTARKSAAGKRAVAESRVKKVGAAQAAEQTGATTVVAKKTPGTATAAKTAVPKARIAAAVEPGELAVRPGEDPWTSEEVEEARAELMAEMMRLRNEIETSEQSLVGLMRDSGDGAGDDQADTGAKNITREHELALAANAREMLTQTERALEKLDAGTYGLCENCGNPIGKARMQAFPRATLCVECKQKQERRY